jgi:hypothetical protein
MQLSLVLLMVNWGVFHSIANGFRRVAPLTKGASISLVVPRCCCTHLAV